MTVPATKSEGGPRRLPHGWLGWVREQSIHRTKSPKLRPFCRLCFDGARALWVLRTTKPRGRGADASVPSPPSDVYNGRYGWFVVGTYWQTAASFDPGGERAGQVGEQTLQRLEAALREVYYPAKRRDRRRQKGRGSRCGAGERGR